MYKKKNIISKDEVELLNFKNIEESIKVKFFSETVQAGFPSPAQDFTENPLSLDERYLSHYDSTYLVKVKGDSMYPTLIENDILIVRADLQIKTNSIVIVSVNNTDYSVKRIDKRKNILYSDNKLFPHIYINESDTVVYLGSVVALIRDL